MSYAIWNPQHRANPQALYAQIRAEAPVYRAIGPVSGNPFWFITGYESAVSALKDPRLGKEAEKHLPPHLIDRWRGGGEADDTFAMLNRHLLNMDPPDHTRLRGLVHKAFTPRMVEDLRERIQQIADTLLDTMHGPVDLLESYAFPLPITVIAELLGVPVRDQDRFRAWTRALLFATDQQQAGLAAMEFNSYMQALLDERQADPQDDLLSALLQAEEDGDKLDRLELMGMIFLLLVAGHETTVNLIGNGTLALLQHPEQRADFLAHLDDPAVVKSTIEEMLRYNGPVETATLRIAFEDVTLDGVTIPRGDGVLVVLVAANRDPAIFPDPDRFDIRRDPNKHIAFGNGIHYCLGAPLARLEGQIALPALFKRFPDLQLNTPVESLAWNENLLLHGMQALPVRLPSVG